MAKAYAIRNITNNPARPIMMTIGASCGDPGVSGKSKLISTDGIPVFFSEDEYNSFKDSAERLKNGRMIHVDVIERKEKAPEPKKETEPELPEIPFEPVDSIASVVAGLTLDQCTSKEHLETYAISKHGIDIDNRKSFKTLLAELKKLEG
jgi:hypothetical protein